MTKAYADMPSVCEHNRLKPSVSLAHDRHRDDGSIVIDVWCDDCGDCGSLFVEPSDVEWGEE